MKIIACKFTYYLRQGKQSELKKTLIRLILKYFAYTAVFWLSISKICVVKQYLFLYALYRINFFYFNNIPT